MVCLPSHLPYGNHLMFYIFWSLLDIKDDGRSINAKVYENNVCLWGISCRGFHSTLKCVSDRLTLSLLFYIQNTRIMQVHDKML